MKYIILEKLNFREDAEAVTEINAYSGLCLLVVKSENKTLRLFFYNEKYAEIAYENLKDFFEVGKDNQKFFLDWAAGLKKAEFEAEADFLE